MDYISGFDRKGKPLSDLSRAEHLMKLVGSPHKELKFIHVAGTNGKGSVCQYLSEILQQCGLKTGLFTSPYLIEYSDRIKINGKNIPQADLERVVEKLKPLIESSPLKNDFSQFEITQAVAFTYFKEQATDVAVLETGVGGLLDCTNVITPLLSVITSISLDHTAILGDSIPQIAFQKAGIIKENRPCVLSCSNAAEAADVVKKTAAEKKSPLIIPDMKRCKIISSSVSGSEFEYKGEIYKISMPGVHQIENALCAIEACNILKNRFEIPADAVKVGLERAKLIGRTEIVGKDPLTILDGGHNPDGTAKLAEVLKNVPKPVVAVIGMHRDKNVRTAVKNLLGAVDLFITVDGFSFLDEDKYKLAEIISSQGGNAQVGSDDIFSDIKKARELSQSGTALICGSLYLAAFYHTGHRQPEK